MVCSLTLKMSVNTVKNKQTSETGTKTAENHEAPWTTHGPQLTAFISQGTGNTERDRNLFRCFNCVPHIYFSIFGRGQRNKQRIQRRTPKNKDLRNRAPKSRFTMPKWCICRKGRQRVCCSESSRMWLPRGVRHRIQVKALLLSRRNYVNALLNFLSKPLGENVFSLFKTAGCLGLRLDGKFQVTCCGYCFISNRKHTAAWKAHEILWKLHCKEAVLFGT